MPRRPRIIRALFRAKLEEDALADIHLALPQGLYSGHGRCGEKICAATAIRRTRKQPEIQAYGWPAALS